MEYQLELGQVRRRHLRYHAIGPGCAASFGLRSLLIEMEVRTSVNTLTDPSSCEINDSATRSWTREAKELECAPGSS